jgi:putative ABC transport system permease protein
MTPSRAIHSASVGTPPPRGGDLLRRRQSLQASSLLRPYALLYLYRRRLRVHRIQELLAGLGVAVAVALVSATMIANGSIAGSATDVVHAVVGSANLQLRARDANGMDERLLAQIVRLPGVAQAAPLLEQTATISGPRGRLTVTLAGTDVSTTLVSGLARTLPIATLSPHGIGLSRTAADELGVSASTAAGEQVSLELRGVVHQLSVAAVLGQEAAGALSQARVAFMPLRRMQQLAGLSRRLTRILVEAQPGQSTLVRSELLALARGRLTVAAADEDVAQLHQALRPSDQASAFFAAISALLGFLFAFNAMLLTVPERRKAIADLRLIGMTRTAIVQMVAFQALCLGIAASLAGLLAGYALSLGVFHQSSGYLAEAFTLGTSTVVDARPLLLSLLGGVLATFLASAVPLLDLRRGRALDAVYFEDVAPGNALSRRSLRLLALTSLGLLALAGGLFELRPSLALIASGLLALATVLALPLVFTAVLCAAGILAERYQRLTSLPVALMSLKSATLRSLALAATGTLAIFGGIALGGSREDLLRGIGGFAHSYAADAQVWVANPGDDQATVMFMPDRLAARIARVAGVASVNVFQGGFLELADRRAWVIARPAGTNRQVLDSQIIDGNPGTAVRRLGEGGWIALSKQIAGEQRVGVGGSLELPTPTGTARLRIAATTTNLAWSPGAIFMGTSDYSRLWATTTPTTLGVELEPGASVAQARQAIEQTIGAASGLEVSSAKTREARIDALTSEGLSRLGEISTLLVVAAILALAAALGSSIWQRRLSLAGLRLSGVHGSRLRRILLTESMLLLSAGCLTGALAGILGQVVIDGYLKHVTGFPVAKLAASGRPFEILALVIAIVLMIATIPGWSASRVSPTLALEE